MSENIEYCWDEFVDWCEDTGVGLEYQEDWGAWWDCWKSAISFAAENRNPVGASEARACLADECRLILFC